MNCSSGSETDDESMKIKNLKELLSKYKILYPYRTVVTSNVFISLKTLLTTLDESDQSSEDEYQYER